MDGATTGARFHAYVADTLAPTLRLGDTVLLDNLSAHKVAGVREAVEKVGAQLLLPPSLLARLQPHRASLRQAESPATHRGGAHRARPLGRHSRGVHLLHPGRVPKLPRRIRL